MQKLVTELVDQRIKDGQLSECDLTFREMDEVSRTFVKVLSGMYHSRVKYPTARGQA